MRGRNQAPLYSHTCGVLYLCKLSTPTGNRNLSKVADDEEEEEEEENDTFSSYVSLG